MGQGRTFREKGCFAHPWSPGALISRAIVILVRFTPLFANLGIGSSISEFA